MKTNNRNESYHIYKRIIIIVLAVTTILLIGRTMQMSLLYIINAGPSFNDSGTWHEYIKYTIYDKGIFVLQIISLIAFGVIKLKR